MAVLASQSDEVPAGPRQNWLHVGRVLSVSLGLLLVAILGTRATTAAPGVAPIRLPGGMQYVAFQPTDEDIRNPGRGVQRSYEGDIGTWAFVDADQTTPRRQMYLPVSEGRLPESLLAGVQRDLQWAADRGLLVDLRFAYSRGFGGAEPSFGAMLRHQQQLAPIVHEFARILNTLGLGLIGPWGEQHSVRAAGFNEPDDGGAYPKRLQLLRGWLDGAPPGLVVTLRYPHQLRWMIEQGGLSASELAMTGVYNDGFLANVHHDGTFRGSAGDLETIERDKEWLAEFTRTHPSRAESNVADSNSAEYARAGTNWLTDGFARYHIDTLREWGLAAHALENRKVWSEVQRKLGYRLVLRGAVLPETVRSGERVAVELFIENEGYAPPRRAHQVVLFFGDHAATVEWVDPREWMPGSHTARGTVTVPLLASGAYDLWLGLPDSHPALLADPRYAIRLANRNEWDAPSGTHRLHATATVVG